MFVRSEKGQIVIIFLGLMGIALGLGLAAARRTVTSIKTGSQSELSTKAYFAAEAGAEKALATDNIVNACPQAVPCTLPNLDGCSASYYAEYSTDLSTTLGKDRVLAINTEGSQVGGSINLAWNRGGGSNGIEVLEVYGSLSSLQTRRMAYYCGSSRTGFSPSAGPSGAYSCSTGNISFSANTRKLIIKMLFAGGTPAGDISYSSSGLVSDQGIVIYSTGTCGDIQRKVKVTRQLSSSGSDFDFGIFAPFDNLDMN